MRLRLIRYAPATAQEPRRRPLATWEVDGDGATLGSAAHATLCAADLPPEAAELRRLANGAWSLTPRCPGWRHGGQELRETLPLRNGERLALGAEEWLAAYQFEATERHRRSPLLPWLAAVLVATVLLLELGLAAWLPRRAAQLEQGGIELLRQQTVRLLDGQRARLATLRQRLAQQPGDLAWLALISQELDLIAAYLRQHGDHLRGPELRQVHGELLAWQKLLADQADATLLPPPTALEPAESLRRWLPPTVP